MFRRWGRCAAIAAATVMLAVPASAHEQRAVGPVRTTVGWLTEPAFAGVVNGVSLRATRDGAGVEGATLKVDVTFADATEPLTLTLSPVFREAGHYQAHLIPTRPGAYTFRIYGRLAGKAFDQRFTSGDDTFDPITSSDAVEYPEQDPTRDQLAQRAAQQEQRIARLQTAADQAQASADLAKALAVVALVLGAAGLFSGIIKARKAA